MQDDDADLAWVDKLHRAIDTMLVPVARAHAGRLQCRAGCSGCCVDDLTVFELEAELLRTRHASLFAGQAAHPPGACALLDADGACRAYEDRPYVCRTQGLPLRWVDEDEDGAPVEARDVCELNQDGVGPLEELEASACWTLGPVELRLRERQLARDGGAGTRVPLRSLFADSGAPARVRLPIAPSS